MPKQIKFNHDQLIELIKESSFSPQEEKQEWLELLPQLSPDQITKVIQFFKQAENRLANVQQKYVEKKSIIFKSLLSQLKNNLQKGKRFIWQKFEGQSQKADEKLEEDLLQKLDNL